MRVLVADDDATCRLLLVKALQRLGHEAVATEDGEQAWEAFRDSPEEFPMVISDWCMPKMTGVELCDKIRSSSRAAYSYLVLVTSLSADENLAEGFRRGADDYLVKPLDVRQLEARIKVAARVGRAMDARIESTLRNAVEAVQAASSKEAAVAETLQSLGEFYQRRRAYAKARGLLRRQIREARAKGDATADLQDQLAALEGYEDAAGLEQARAVAAKEVSG